jgi:DnaK suppressor protein
MHRGRAQDETIHHTTRYKPMNTEQAAPFQQQLITLRSQVLEQLAAQRGGTLGRADAAAEHFGHPEDSRAQVYTERDIEFALGEHETAHLAAIDAALERIQTGSYGECTDCGADIGAARLHAAPEAARCLVCQEKAEK